MFVKARAHIGNFASKIVTENIRKLKKRVGSRKSIVFSRPLSHLQTLKSSSLEEIWAISVLKYLDLAS